VGTQSAFSGEVVDAVSEWPSFASEAGVEGDEVKAIAASHRLELPRE
jgi:hypothetical protein